MKSFKFYLLIILSTVCATQIHGQITINGTVTDSELNPISNALVEIIDETDTSNIYSDFTDVSGKFLISNITDIEGQSKLVPADHIVLRNYPNPFNPTTVIYFELPKSENIEVKIYDILGREVRTLYNNYNKAGIYRMTWDGRNNFGGGVAAGVYFCRLKTKDQFKVHKMVLLDGGSNTGLANKLQKSSSKFRKTIEINEQFKFTLSVREKYINPIEIHNLTCTSDTTITITAEKSLFDVIGPEGGIISNENFYMSIPSSALSNNTEIIIYQIPKEFTPVDTAVTNTYLVTGIPSDYNSLTKIGLKYSGELTDENVIEFGSKEFIPGLYDSLISYFPVSATDSAGFLWTTFPLLNDTLIPFQKLYSIENQFNFNSIRHKYIRGKDKRVWMASDNFVGHIPMYAYDVPIFQYLETAWSKYKAMGFTFKPDNIPYGRRPCSIVISWLRDTGLGYEEPVIYGYGSSHITHDLVTYVPDERNISTHFFGWLFIDQYPYQDQLQSIIGIVLFDAIAHVYENSYENPVFQHRYLDLSRYWFHKAVAYWAGELFTTDNNYIPPGFKGNEMAPFHGMIYGAGKTNQNILVHHDKKATNHGYGMSSLVKFLLDEAKNNGTFNTLLSNVYNEIFTVGENPVFALKHNMNRPIENWLYDFYKEYLSGKIYNVPSSVFLNAKDDDLVKIEINDNAESSFTLRKEFPDLSAKLYQFKFNYDETNENNELQLLPKNTLDSQSNPSTLLFGLKNNKLEFIDGGISKIACNIKEVQNEGYKTLLAAVINHDLFPNDFYQTAPIELEIKIEEKKETEIQFKKCVIHFTVASNYNTDSGPKDLSFFGYWEFKNNISFDGNHFSARWDTSDTYINEYQKEVYSSASLYFTGDIDMETKTITNFYAENQKLSYLEDFNRNETFKTIKSNELPLPKYSEGEGWFSCKLTGSEIDFNKLIMTERLDSYFYYSDPDEHTWLELNLPKESDDNVIEIIFYH